MAGCSDDDGDDDASEDTTDNSAPSDSVFTDANTCDEIPESGQGALNEGAVVNMIEFEFCQAEVTIETGQAVTFENNGSGRHQVTHQPPGDQERTFGADGAMLVGDTYIAGPFDEPGTYPYICSFHFEQMTGTIIVE
jgi:plastocyanin